MISILGGKQVAYNFAQLLRKQDIECLLLTFPGEWSQKKGCGITIEEYDLVGLDNVVISSETALNYLQYKFPNRYKIHHYLRDKRNLPIIASQIDVNYLESLHEESINKHFPVILKPIHANTGVPFKTKIVLNDKELGKYKKYLDLCIVQQYLSKSFFTQISIAGYYNGKVESLICVDQLNQYPMGTSSHVRLNPNHQKLIKSISRYLQNISFKGFIELEFKYSPQKGYFLMDINPRLWGWSYFYFSGIKNLQNVLFSNESPQLSLKNEWIHPLRMLPALLFSNLSYPKAINVFGRNICIEPINL